MKRYLFLIPALAFLIPLFAGNTVRKPLPEKVKTIYVLSIKEEIAPPVRRKVQKGFEAAGKSGAELIIIHMNTYGGMLDAADSIRTIILTSEIPVWVFIDNNAASAGALISIACDSIFMRPGANIGAATVVDQTGKALPDKYQSYMRSMMRSTAEAKGRDPQIAQAMVDPRIVIPGIVDSTMVLTFTTSEAMKNGFCEGEAESITEILQRYGFQEATVIVQRLNALDKVIGFLINPFVSGILILIIIGGIYFELQTPGLGFPSAAAIVAAVLYFAPLYLEGLAAHWEILVFMIGVILVAVELFAIPGFGITGIAGIALIVTGLTLSLVDSMVFELSAGGLSALMKAFFTVIVAAFAALIGSFYISKRIFSRPVPLLGYLALDTVQDKDEGYSTADYHYAGMVGHSGTAFTILKPSGKVMIDNEIYEATATSGYIEKGEAVVVVRYETAQLFVKKAH